jgi:hypothetical protein
MKSFAVFYNKGVADGLSIPRSKEDAERNAGILKERLAANLEQLVVAKMLDGLIIHSRQELMGTLCVSGPESDIDRLKAFLEERALGTVLPNEMIVKGA